MCILENNRKTKKILCLCYDYTRHILNTTVLFVVHFEPFDIPTANRDSLYLDVAERMRRYSKIQKK